jgi:excisionase family DNA binding protein
MEKLYSIKEAASVLSVSPKTIQKWLLDGRLRGVKLGGKIWRITESALAELVQKSRTNEGKPAIVEEAKVWLEAELDRLNDYEPYEWEPGELEEGEPVRYIPGKGLVVEESRRRG